MSTSTSIRRAVHFVLLTSAATAAAMSLPAHAQNAEITEVVVTGSRIASPNLESISPVKAISQEDITMTGKVRIEDIINQLPQAFASQGSSIANASDGTATVDLRKLGDRRTLVLVNGRRLMPGDPDGGSAADLNQIPASLVSRVDVLTGGASSVYGADAVAGVVNFVMDTDFEGVRIDANYSFYQHENDNPAVRYPRARGFQTPDSNVTTGYSKDFTFALGVGSPGDRGHATFYASYRDVDPILQAEYDRSACTLNNTATDFTCGGSLTTNPAAFFLLNQTPVCTDADGCVIGPNGVLRTATAADQFNFGPYNYYQRPDERYTAGVFANFDVSDSIEVYGEMMFMDDRTVAQIAPSGSFFTGHQVNCNNPFFSASMVQEFCTSQGLSGSQMTTLFVGRRNTEGGGRQDDIGHESVRMVGGVRGDINADWNFDAYFQHGTTKRNSTYFNDFSSSRTTRALQVGIDPATGQPACLSFIDGSDPNCVPWNIWQPNGVTPEALAYLQTPGLLRAEARQQIAHADVTGDLTNFVQLPGTASGLAINVGAEYRDERTEFIPDTAFSTGDLAGQGGATTAVNGGFNVTEMFAEARLPLIEGKAFANSVTFETGYRYSDYSTGYTTDTYKAGLDWEPIEAVRLRGSFQHAVRAPNVGELFSSNSVALDGSTDPCATATPQATLEQCVLTGLDPSRYGSVAENPAGQYNGLLGGNLNLKPESSDTVSFGVVYRPDFANLTVALDYFDITIEDTISATTGGNADTYINECISTGNPEFCSLINRDALGSLWLTPNGFIVDTSRNIGQLSTKGLDVQVDYGLDFGAHRMAFALVGTYLDEFSTEPVSNGDAFDCVGFYGNQCGVPAPEWRHSLRTSWGLPWYDVNVNLTWRYFGSVKSERTSSDSQLAPDGTLFSTTDDELGSRSYFDLSASMTLMEQYTLRVGANNLLDKDPPLVGSGTARGNCPTGPCNGNTYPQVYDALGRQLFLAVTVDF